MDQLSAVFLGGSVLGQDLNISGDDDSTYSCNLGLDGRRRSVAGELAA